MDNNCGLLFDLYEFSEHLKSDLPGRNYAVQNLYSRKTNRENILQPYGDMR